MLGVDNPITYIDIHGATSLSHGHPVFLILGNPAHNPRDKVVVKKESGNFTALDVAANVKIARVADPGARQKVMSAQEVFDLEQWVDVELVYFPANAAYVALKAAFPGAGVWLRMEEKALTNLQQAEANRLAGDKTGVRAFAEALNATGGLETLGRILAADLFNGNTDRVDVNNGGVNKTGGGSYNYISNVGNLLLQVAPNGAARPIGLDSMDPSSPFKDVTQTVAAQELGVFWPGRLLDPAQQIWLTQNGYPTLAQFCAGLIADIEAALGPRNRKIPFARTQRLNANAATRLQTGVNQGAQDIRQQLIDWTANKPAKMTMLMQSRRQVLNW